MDGDGVDARAALEQLLHDCRHLEDLDVVVVSGDAADDGSVPAYRDVLALVGAYAAAKGAASVFCVGNHDERTAFQAVLGRVTATAAAPTADDCSWRRTAARRSATWTVSA